MRHFGRTLVVALLTTISLATTACASGAAGPAGETTGGSAGSTAGSSGPSPVAGTWRAPEPATAWLTFDEDGAVTGSDGCNPVNGRYQLTDDVVHFDLEFTTLKACVGVTVSFAALTSAVVDGDSLVARDSHDAELAVLARE